MKKNIPQILYHYTRLENLTSIIRREEKDSMPELVFWLTNFKLMNDISEGGYIRKVLLYSDPKFSYTKIPDMYVLSLCKEHNNLSMWKEYADNVSGIVLALDPYVLTQSKYRCMQELYKCSYDEKKNKKCITQIAKDVNQYIGSKTWEDKVLQTSHYAKEHPEYIKDRKVILTDKYSALFQKFAPILALKKQCYSYENEWRLIYNNYTSDLLHFRINDNHRMIEYWEFHANIEALKGIYVGSNNHKDTINSIRKYLNNIGLETNIYIKKVNLPYRK